MERKLLAVRALAVIRVQHRSLFTIHSRRDARSSTGEKTIVYKRDRTRARGPFKRAGAMQSSEGQPWLTRPHQYVYPCREFLKALATNATSAGPYFHMMSCLGAGSMSSAPNGISHYYLAELGQPLGPALEAEAIKLPETAETLAARAARNSTIFLCMGIHFLRFKLPV